MLTQQNLFVHYGHYIIITELHGTALHQNTSIFLSSKHSFLSSYPGRDNRRISTILGDHWKRMNKEEKIPFQEMARELMRKTKEAYPDFKYSPNDIHPKTTENDG